MKILFSSSSVFCLLLPFILPPEKSVHQKVFMSALLSTVLSSNATTTTTTRMNPPETSLNSDPSTTILNSTVSSSHRNMAGFASLINLKDECALTRGRRIQISQLGVTATNKSSTDETGQVMKKRWSFHSANQISELLREDKVMKPISSPKRRKSSGSGLLRSTSDPYSFDEELEVDTHRRHRVSLGPEQSQSARHVLSNQHVNLHHRHHHHHHPRGKLINMKGDNEAARRQRYMDDYVIQADAFPANFHQFRIRKSKHSREPPASDYLSPMPDEVLLRIFKHLPIASLANLGRTSRRFLGLMQDDTLWKRLCVMGKILGPEHILIILSRKPVYLRMARTFIADPTELPSDQTVLASSSQLLYLDLSSATITPSTLAFVLKISPKLVKLSLEHLTVTKEVLESMMPIVTSLEVLNLAMCYDLDAKALVKFLSSCKRPRELNLACLKCDWGMEELTEVVQALPGTVQQLNISGFRNTLDNSHVALIASRCPKLIELDISDSQEVQEKSMEHFLRLAHLQHLGLSRCYGINPTTYPSLTSHKSLKYLDLFSLFKENSIRQLSNNLPGIEINKFPFSAIARPTVGNKRSSIWLQRVRD